MGALEAIIGGIITLALLLFGAHRVGKSQGKAEAQADAKSRPLPLQSPPLNAGLKSSKRPAMYSRLLTICLMTMLIGSCATTGPAKVELSILPATG
jgi:hypothetical protein